MVPARIARLGGPWRGLAIATAFASLAACLGPIPPPATEVAPAPVEAPVQAGDPAPVEPQNTDDSPAARAARVASLPPPADPAPEAPRLVGLSRELLLDVLGPAGFVRRDGPVQIWRYSAEDCFLDVFLYRDGNGFHVKHVEARPKGAGQASLNACYRHLVEARRNGRPG